ncbi:MAG: hypothetical protein ACJ741_04025 [Pyrinomonadaceae bacterium]
MTEEQATKLRERLDPLVGQRAWGVSVGHGSFLTFEFGPVAPQRFGGKKQHGEWHLWLYMTGWRVDVSSNVIASSDDDRAQMERGAATLDGRTVTAVEVSAPRGDLTLQLGDATVRTFVVESDAEQWLLYTPTGTVLEVGADANWTEEPGSSAG